MPVFTEVATSQRELRVQPSYALPLPDLGEKSGAEDREDRFDVVVVGAGPCGLLLTLLLARYGLKDSRLLCIDSKPGTLRSGQADGLQPRTQEVISSLGLQHEIFDQGCQFWEISFWDPDTTTDGRQRIKRTSYGPDVDVPSQFPHETTIHQGRIERIFDDDLKRYSKHGVERSTSLLSARIDDGLGGDQEFPVTVEVEKSETPAANQRLTRGKHTIRCKYLIGADGAHSVVRRSMGMHLTGESREFIWGVMDFVADTKFPDIRRKSMVQSAAGSCMIIPRERIATGEYLTRIYAHMDETDSVDDRPGNMSVDEAKQMAKEKRMKVSVERILGQADQVLQPYGLKMKEGTEPDWWAAYEIGQRTCEDFIRKDKNGTPRVFLAGDACHTHSPKAGQGMNVSMMDAYNLAWKLAHSLLAIVPERSRDELLMSYETERRAIARELIEYDTKLSTAFSTKGGGDGSMTADQLNEVWRVGHGFTSGCGIEYGESGLVRKERKRPDKGVQKVVSGEDYLAGILRPGRRLLNVRVLRHADGRPTDLHEEFPSTGRFRILFLCSTDLMEHGSSSAALKYISATLARYSKSLLELVVLHPLDEIRGVDWDQLPPEIYEHAEMKFFSSRAGQAARGKEDAKWGSRLRADDAYKTYGVDPSQGAIVVVRPDQVVGLVAPLAGYGLSVEKYLDRWLGGQPETNGVAHQTS